MEKIKSYRDLQVWQRAVELGVRVYQVTESFPRSEQYGLVNQMRRAAVSVASNIAEGYGRSEAEFARYLEMSRGSLAELETQMEIARRVKYLSDLLYTELNQEANILEQIPFRLMVLDLSGLTSRPKIKRHRWRPDRSAPSTHQEFAIGRQLNVFFQRVSNSQRANRQRPTASRQPPAASR